MRHRSLPVYLALHLLLLFYTAADIFSKMAAAQVLLSTPFILCYGVVLAVLVVYALGWQQVIKRLPLTTAYANRGITVVWGIIWGALFFQEAISLGKLIGAMMIIIGIVLFSYADKSGDEAPRGTSGASQSGPNVDASTRTAPTGTPGRMGDA